MKFNLKFLVVVLIVLFFFLIILFFYASFSSSSDLFGDVISEIDTNEKVIFLTFDDGPSYNSNAILNILDEKDVKASFFVLGRNILEGREDILKNISQSGHDIGTHSMTHSYLNNNLYEELFKSKLLIEKEIGKNISLFRPSYGFRTPETIKQAEKYGLKTIMWSSFPRDYVRDRNYVLNTVISDLKPGVIIVMHDIGKENLTTLEVLPELIDSVRKKNYTFGLLSDYLS